MKKLFGMFAGVLFLMAVQNANARGGGSAAGSDYLVVVKLHHAIGVQGHLEIFSLDKNGNPTDTERGCEAIGGNEEYWAKKDGSRAKETPAGIHRVEYHSDPLWYMGEQDSNYRYASYFANPNPLLPADPADPANKRSDGKGNKMAIHTAVTYETNSHGCVRAPCAKEVYDLQGVVSVQIDYVD